MSRYRVGAGGAPPPPPLQASNGSIMSSSQPDSHVLLMKTTAHIKTKKVQDAAKEVEWMNDMGQDLDSVKFAPVQIKDKFALSLFILQLLLLAVVLSTAWSDDNAANIIDMTMDKVLAVKVFASTSAVAAILSAIWLVILRTMIHRAVVMTIGVSVLVLGSISGIAVMQGEYGWAIFWGVVLVIFSYYFYLIRKRIPFATLMLKAAINVVFKFPATIVVAYGAMVVQCCWLIFWGLCYLIVWPHFGNNPFVGFGLLVSLFWTSQVITNVVHVTVAGTTSYWYFCYDCLPKNPTARSLSRTLTVSLGSISMGSLLTSIIKTIRVVLEGLRRSNNGEPSFTVIMAGVTLKWIECIARYFNSYAFTYIAIYGKNFTTSSRKTWDLLQKCGLDAIINDDIIGGTIMLSAFLVASMTGFLGAAWAVSIGIKNWFWGVGLPCSLLGYILGVITFNVVESAVLSIYVCFAEDPDALYYNERDLYEKLTDAQEMGVLDGINSDSSTESDDTSVGDYTTSEDEENLRAKDDFDDLTPEQLAEISSDDEEEGLVVKKKKKKWYQRISLPTSLPSFE